MYPLSVLQTLYNTLVLPHLSYCVLSLGAEVEDIHKLQKKALRIISYSKFRAHTEPICKTLNMLKIKDIYQLSIMKFYYKLVNKKLPHYFDNFTPSYSIGSDHYNLRNPCRQLPKIRHQFPRQSLRYKLIIILNQTPNDIIDLATVSSIQSFSSRIRTTIIDAYNLNCNIDNCFVCNDE